MISLALSLFLSLFILAYVYLGYPFLLYLATRGKGQQKADEQTSYPGVTLIISAYNEEDVIREKLENSLRLNYPEECLDLLVVSDASDDGTDTLVKSCKDARVRLLRMEHRVGKSLGLNQAAAQATGEIIVFTDANAMFQADAIRHLVAHFQDPTVGVVTGEQRYFESCDDSAKSEGLYWRYELLLKRLESTNNSLVGGDGAIMAIRKRLFPTLDADDLSDFLIPLKIVERGYRNRFEHYAACYEHGAESYAKEFARKVRIVNRAWRATMKMKHMLNPLIHGWFAVQLISHKVLRWLTGVFMVTAFISNVLLVAASPFYAMLLFGQCLFYGAALVGFFMAQTGRASPGIISIPFYLCLVNYAGLKGIIENYLGKRYTTWTTVRAK